MKWLKWIKRRIGPIVMLVSYILMGLGCGLMMARMIDRTGGGLVSMLIVFLVGLYGSLLFHIIAHEAGHMIFGLLTGYRFCSFRIGAFVWQRTAEGRVSFGRSPLAGAAGQCLMAPPEMKDGKMPFVLYNLGGALANFIVAAICLAASALTGSEMAKTILWMCALVGIVTGLTNAVPLRMGAVDNDGYNILSMKKSPEAVRSLWVQLKVAEQNALGVRLRDLPEEWFILPNRAEMKNSLCAAVGVFHCGRLMDDMKFEEAKRAMLNVLRMGSGMVGLHRVSMKMDLIYCELAAGKGKGAAEKWLDKDTRKIMKAMKTHIGVLRCEHVLALLGEGDKEKAEKIERQFEEAAGKWPSDADIQSERELIEYAKECARRREEAGEEEAVPTDGE